MITVSNEFKTEAKTGVAKDWKAYIVDQGVYPDEITESDDLKSLKISSKSSLLRTVMRQLDATFFGSHDYLDKYVNPGLGLRLPDTSVEYIDYGSFIIKEQEFDKGIDLIKIKGYDKMFEALIPYDLDPIYEVGFPADLTTLLEAICTRLDWTLATGSDVFPNDDYEITSDPITGLGLTFREVLDRIAEASGSIIYFNEDDELVVKQISHDTPLEDLDANVLQKLKVEGKYGEINSVVLARTPQEDNILDKDDDSIALNGLTEIKIKNNPLVDDDRETAVTPILNELLGLWYYPFDADTNGLGYIQIGDRITVTDPTEIGREVVVFEVVITMTGGVKETLGAAIPDKDSTNYNIAGIIGKTIKDTQIIVDKQKGEITLLNQNLNESIAQINLTTDTITSLVNQAIAQGDVNADDIDDLVTNLTTLTQTVQGLEIAVEGIGGTNLLKNSVGLKGIVEEWQVLDSNGDPVDADNDATIDNSTNVEVNSESGSALRIDEQFIQQSFPTIAGETYTFYCRYKSQLTVTLSITGITDITMPEATDWTVFKTQFVATGDNTTLVLSNVASGAGAYAILTDNVIKLGDANGWVQAPNEVYGTNFKFDKDGFEITSLTDTFRSVLDNQKLAVYDMASGKIVMLVSKDSGRITKLTAQEEFVIQRYENSEKSARFIPTDTGMMLVIND